MLWPVKDQFAGKIDDVAKFVITTGLTYMRPALLSISILTLFGCSHLQTAKERSAFDLDCPVEKIEVKELPGDSIGAIGCGKRVAYKFWGPFFGAGSRCIKESETQH